MQSTRKYLLWLHLLWATPVSVVAQQDSTLQIGSDTTINTPSPVSTNRFSLDSISKDHEEQYVQVRNIYFEGNKITRKVILLRELPFAEGDTLQLSKLPELFAQAKTQISNTSLFDANNTNVSLQDIEGNYIDIKISVKERWYIYPLPYVKPVDRNLNEWLFKRGASASRVDYGVKLHYDNMTGNNDKLRFYFITGYTQQLLLSYNRPYIDNDLKWGLNVSLALGKNHEINYNTEENKQVFLNHPDEYMRKFFEGTVELSYRPEFFTRHIFGLGYNTLSVADTVVQLNPDFLHNGITQIRYPRIYYKMIYQNLDYIPYPTRGYAAELTLLKQGFSKNMNVTQLIAKGQGNWRLGEKTFYNISVLGSLKVPFSQPFYNSQLLGYGDMTLRGYEYYVIDGVAGGLVNATFYKQLTNFSFSLPFLKWLTGRLIPLKIYSKVYGNAGYVYQPQPGTNHLAKKALFGGGIGFDVWSWNDFTFKFEFSFNQLGENGIYLQRRTLY